MGIEAQERAAVETVTLQQEADVAAAELFGDTMKEEQGEVYDLGDAEEAPAEAAEASTNEQQHLGDAVDAGEEDLGDLEEAEQETEEEQKTEAEEKEPEKKEPEKKRRKKSRGDRYKASAQRAWQKYEEQRSQFNEALLVANALKVQRDDAYAVIKQLEQELEEYGREFTPQERELREYKLQARQDEIEKHLRQQMQEKESEHANQMKQEQLVDQMVEEANLLEEKYGVEADLILLRYTKADKGSTLEQVAKQLSGNRKVQAGQAAKKQKQLNKAAPRTGVAKRGAAARTNLKRKPGDWEAMIEQAAADVMDWRSGS